MIFDNINYLLPCLLIFDPFGLYLIQYNKMNILNNYLVANPTPNFTSTAKKSNKKLGNHYEYYNNDYKKRSASLIDIYSTKVKQLHTITQDRLKK